MVNQTSVTINFTISKLTGFSRSTLGVFPWDPLLECPSAAPGLGWGGGGGGGVGGAVKNLSVRLPNDWNAKYVTYQ